jgi:hypothetical protein
MVVVNFVGGLAAVPATLKHHHTHLSYADTLMPGFLFAVGFGLRASLLHRAARDGRRAAYLHAGRRGLALVLLGAVVYGLTGGYTTWADLTAAPFPDAVLAAIKRGPFEALGHIGATVLWCAPVAAGPGWLRLLFAAASGGGHVWASHAGYYQWNLSAPRGIDGGPLGFLTWALPLIAGTFAHDLRAGRLLAAGVVLAAAGTALSLGLNPTASPPFVAPAALVPDYWVMSQRAGSVTYLLAGAGVSAILLAVFRLTAANLPPFDLLGRHALAAYLIHDPVGRMVRPFCPADAPAWWVAGCLLIYIGVTLLFVRHLDRNRLVLRL